MRSTTGSAASPRHSPPPLLLRFKKARDSDAVLTCVRADGGWTSARIGTPHGYGPVHDLAHYVAERALAIPDGFLGLVAAGWDIRDFERPGAAATLPDGAALAECLAGELSRQEMMAQYSAPDELDWAVRAAAARGRPHFASAPIPAAAVAAMRAELVALRQRWDDLPDGETLELRFEL